jgi:long-chain acyl-CoA synthetase
MAPETIPALFLDAVRTHDKLDALRQQRRGLYEAMSHREALAAVKAATSGLLASGLSKGDRIALLSENRIEWVIADLAILSAGCVTVPIYATLPANQVEYILRDSEARAVFVSCRAQFDKIASIASRLPGLQHVYSFDPLDGGGPAISLEELSKKGSGLPPEVFDERLSTIGATDWASIIYTSGTTGDPKGAILTHENFVSDVLSCTQVLKIGRDDRCLSCLPLSHAFERTAGYYAPLHRGTTIVYPENAAKVMDNLAEVRPTFVVCVPRLFEKLYAGIMGAASRGPALQKKLFSWAVRTGAERREQLAAGRVRLAKRLERGLAEALVFCKLRARMGGRLRFFVSGGAPLRRDIAEFFDTAGIPILEGYGLTETSPVISVNTFDHFKLGTVGKPIPGVDVRIAHDGEILVKGPNVMQGYFKQPARTAEVLREGWFFTGDIGFVDEDGHLVITDRKKDIIVTTGGKNVAPQLIEGLLKSSGYISQALIVGNDRKFVSAIVVPDFEILAAFAGNAGISFADHTELLGHPEIVSKLRDEIDRVSEPLASFERVKKFVLAEREFSIEEDELTPTLKLKRRVIEKKFREDIDALYGE